MQERPARKRTSVFWLLVLLGALVVWWLWRPRQEEAAWPAGEAEWAEADPDDILVDLVDDAGDDVVAAIERELGIDLKLVSKQSADERFYRAHVDPARRDAVLAALAARSDVEVAEPDAQVTLAPLGAYQEPEGDAERSWEGFPNDPEYKHQWHLRQIGMPRAWKLADGRDVIVAVVDTGVAYEDHQRFHRVPDLAGVKFVEGYDFVNDGPHANDDHGHGTHVAGTIAQATHNGIGVAGVARRAVIMPLKVLSAAGSGSVAAIADAIRYAADRGAKVINLSLGGRFPSKVLARAVAYAREKGAVVVCAAGNDGRGKVSYPAAYPGAFAVAATQYDETTTFYSNWGKEIDIAAPGGNTRVDQDGDGRPDGVLQNTIVVGDPTRDGYFAFMGTSMASPHVAGVAALLVGAGVTEPAAVEKILQESARAPKLARESFDRARYGAGIVDAPAALALARRKEGGSKLALGLLVAGAVAATARRRGLGVLLGAPFWSAVVAGSSGLFFLPDLVGSGMGPLAHGLPSWGLALFGAGAHGSPLLFSALVPVGAVALLLGARRARPALAGLAVGVAAHLLFHAVARTTDVRWIPDVLDGLWLVANAALCAGLGYLVLLRE